jgi:CubicO group peptidase (beta-lactamase class C family)
MHAYRTLQKVPGLVSIVTNCICAQSMALSPKRVRRELIGMAFITSIVATVCVSGQSQRPALTPPQLASIDTFVTAEMRKEHIPGVAVGVYSRGTMLLAKGYGFSNVELDVPVKVDTVFQSGSVGKQFVSTAAMMLVEDGKLSLDDSIAKYFPDAPATWQSIKLKNLLSHTSGLAEYETPDRTSRSGPFYMRLDFTEDELVKKIQALPIEGAPGEKWAYRNTNYVLVGILIHRVTGMSYTDFLTKRIFLPLGMSSTRPISEADLVPNRAAGYELHGAQLKNQQWVSPTFNSTADGTLYFNVLDLAKWDEALYGTQLLQQSSLDLMWTVFPLNNGQPNAGNYGFGWELSPQNGHRRIEHGGSWQGFTCEISRYPDDSLSVVVLTNLDSGHARPAMFAHVIAGLVQPSLAPPKLEAITDDQPATAAALRRLLDKIVAGQDVHEEVSPELSKMITPNTIKALQASFGPLVPADSIFLVHRHPMPDVAKAYMSVYRVKRGDRSLLVAFALDGNGKVIHFDTREDSDY